jgi:hypothetical protein
MHLTFLIMQENDRNQPMPDPLNQMAGKIALAIIATTEPSERIRVSQSVCATIKRKIDTLIMREEEGQ